MVTLSTKYNKSTLISVKEIAQKFNKTPSVIRHKLRQYQELLPADAIVYASFGQPGPEAMHLRRKYLHQFCELANIKVTYPRHPDYLMAQQIANIIHSYHIEMPGLLKKYQPLMPQGAIQLQKHTSTATLVLHKDYLDMFCEMAGIKRHEPKTSDWLNSHEIATTLHVRHNEFYSILHNMYINKILPECAIQERLNNGYKVLCLHKDYLDAFIEKANLTIVPQKDSTWLSSDEIRKKIGQKLANITTIVKNARTQMTAGAIDFRKSGPQVHLCLHQDYFDEFCAVTGLRAYETKDDTKWIGAREIERTFHISVPEMPRLLEQMQSVLPAGAIEYKKKGKRIKLYLHRDYISEFLIKSGLIDKRPILRTRLSQHTK